MLEEKVEEDVEENRGIGKLRGATPISNLISQCHKGHPNVLFSEILTGSHNTNIFCATSAIVCWSNEFGVVQISGLYS